MARFDVEYDNFWSSEDVCFGVLCGSPNSAYLTSLMQSLIFLAKGATAYFSGRPFAHIRADYKFAQVAIMDEDPVEEDPVDVPNSLSSSVAFIQGEIIDTSSLAAMQATIVGSNSLNGDNPELSTLRQEVKELRVAMAQQSESGISCIASGKVLHLL